VVPAGGVKDLPNNFFINRLVDEFILKCKVDGEEDVKCDKCDEGDPVVSYCHECSLFLCHVCNEAHKRDRSSRGHGIVSLTELQSNKEITIQPKANTPLCEMHDIELLFYCETCEKLVCMYCTVKDHAGHNHDTVKLVAEKHRNELKKITSSVEEISKVVSEAYDNIEEVKKKIKRQSDEVNKKIDQHYEEVFQKVVKQKEQVKKQFYDAVAKKEKVVGAQLKEMEDVQVELLKIKELKVVVEKSSDIESLSAKKQVVNCMQKLNEMYNKILELKPPLSVAMEFVSNKISIPLLGNLFTEVDPKSSEVNNLLRRTVVNKEVSFSITTKYCNGHRCSRGGDQVTVHLKPTTGKTATTAAQVRDNNDGSYTVFFTAQKPGAAKLLVSINGQKIKGSPFNIMICDNYSLMGSNSKIINVSGNMSTPWGIAFGKDGTWAVADSVNYCVYVFNKQDQVMGSIGSKGNGSGKFQYPSGVAFDHNIFLYVADSGNHTVQKFDVRGNYLLQFGGRGVGNGQLSSPAGILAFDDEVYVADLDNRRISVFQSNGQFCRIIGKGQLSAPYDVAVNTTGQLLVADLSHQSIYYFTQTGCYIKKFGTPGTSWGQLKNPCSLSIDMNDFIFVADTGNHCISIFDKDGKFVHCFGVKGSGNGQFDHPRGIAISVNGSIHVSDSWNKRIQIFNY